MDKLKTISQRKRRVSLEQVLKELKVIVQGWIRYFKLARINSKLTTIGGWLCGRLKCFRIKRCKQANSSSKIFNKIWAGKDTELANSIKRKRVIAKYPII